MSKITLLLTISLCFVGWTIPFPEPDHAIYISVIKIHHELHQPIATLQMRVFADDLKDALRNKFGYEAILEKPTFCKDYENYLNGYFKKGFVCTINEAAVAYKLANCERVAEVYELEFTMECPTKWRTAKIDAPFFMELFPNQSNVVHVENGGTKRFGRATKGNELLRIRF